MLTRNPEFKHFLLLLAVLSAICIALAWPWGVGCQVLVGVVCVLFISALIAFEALRYRRIARLSDMLGKLLHNGGNLSLDQYAEGELSILTIEIQKLLTILNDQQSQLRAEKSALSDAIANISHQLKTPLTSINFTVEFLRRRDLTEEKRLTLLRDLSNLTGRIDRLVATLLKLARLDAGVVRMVEADTTIADVAARAAAPLAIPMELKGQTLQLHPNNACFRGDPDWLGEAIGNILKNCMEHTPDGGLITLTAETNALYTEIIITDNGPGFLAADLPHLFERFYRGASSGNGVGIGLALARTIITQQGGSIKAENRRTGGAQFTIRLYRQVI